MFVSLFLLILVILQASGDTECPLVTNIDDRRSNKKSLRLVQYNVEWLFIDYYSGMDCPGNGCTWHTNKDAETHLSNVANIIDILNPDIINLCEVEGCDELNMLINAMETNNAYKPYLKKGTDTGTGQNVGLLTKIDTLVSLYRSEEKVNYPIQNTQCGNSSKTGNTGVSKHYITEFAFGQMNVALIGAHLLAIPTDPDRCVQREAQAQVLQNIIYSYYEKGYEIIVIGDMNDYDNQVPDINDNKPISMTLEILKGISGEQKNKYKLTNVAVKIPKNERYSDWWDSDNNCDTSTINDLSLIDHVLVTDNILRRIKSAYIYHGYMEYCGKWNSDHWPIVIDLIV